MNKESGTHARRLGWMAPDPEREGRYEFAIQEAPLTDQSWRDFERIVGVLAELRPYVVDFLCLERDFADVEGLVDELRRHAADESYPTMIGGVSTSMGYAMGQRAVSNFLASASAFRDRSRARLTRQHGRPSAALAAFNAAHDAACKGSFAYRLLISMRNYAQHLESPVSLIPVSAEEDDAGNRQVSVRVELLREKVINFDRKMDPALKEELVAQPAVIPLLPLLAEFMALHGSLMAALVNAQRERLVEYRDYIGELLAVVPVPEGGTPIIFEGGLPEAPDFEVKTHGFSVPEFELLLRMLERIKRRLAAR